MLNKETKEFKVGCTYSDKRGNKWKITENDNVGCFPLMAECENYKGINCDFPMYYDEFTLKGGYQEDEPSDFDLIWSDQRDNALIEFKRKCKLFNEIADKSGVPTDQDLKDQVRLITEESKELKDTLQMGEPLINSLQELTDVLVVSFGLLEQFRNLGFDVDKALELVADANLSKFTEDDSVALESQLTYVNNGVDVSSSYNNEHNVWVLKDENNKVRKPLDFKKVNLSSCVPVETTVLE